MKDFDERCWHPTRDAEMIFVRPGALMSPEQIVRFPQKDVTARCGN